MAIDPAHAVRLPTRPATLDEPLAHWAKAQPEENAVMYGPRSFTWAEWDDRVRRCAGGLRAMGVGTGDVVAFLDKNHPACVEVTLAAASIGAAHAIVNWRSAGDEVDYALNDCGAKVLFVGEELAETIDGIRDRLTGVEHVVKVTPDGVQGDEYEAMLTSSERVEVGTGGARGEDVCLVMYSSGTTGRPKGVMLTHASMIAHTYNAHEGWGFEEGDKSLVAMPLFHVGGSSYVLFSIFDGVPSVMTREPDGGSLAWAIMNGANCAFLVPAVLAQVLQSGEDAVKLFGTLKIYTYGAAPMPSALLRAAMDAWPDTRFMQVYGLTEVCGVITHLLPEAHHDEEHPERLLSAGTCIPEAEVRVVAPDTLEEVPTGDPGELWFRTPQLMKGYLGKPEETAAVISEDGWFRTGDIGHVDDDGFVFVSDRLKDLIITGGENVYSPEVERVLSEHPAVSEAAVIGVPHDTWGETVKAVVGLKPDAEATEDDIIAFCQERLAKFKSPSSVEIVAALPRNPTGKILKKDLRAPYWEGRERQVV
jgi:acyl-CoA synthetase (AMP-forming)/AMP-acid ligase II